ncbi:hypothetical protein [Paraburkholderia kirstenboschensis]|uniref:Secreted protein n=1 Tax=Paraburkholderia kirstenboschensis TaxID=1245436 RepID=A0ABZ0EFX0_9BURK|nr:hypothetical protein [Paraburkholderia kirstenboschensis]WOD15825.1 hypothetical protein RW095_21550 [Paraburkholderia kirstenboschensis]
MFLFLLLTSPVSIAVECSDGQTAEARLPESVGGTLSAKSCPASDNDGNITVTVFLKGVETTVQTKYESNAYVLRLDTNIRFDAGSPVGIGVSTGKGRDGTGMHYWKMLPTGTLIDLGEAPELVRDKFIPNAYSTLISGTGRYQSTRYFYEVRNNHLVPTRLVGFHPKDRDTYVAELVKISPSGRTVLLSRKTLPAKMVDPCQTGKTICW